MGEQLQPDVVVRIGRGVRAERVRVGLSVVRLAELSGVSRRMLTQIELGQANPSLATVDKIASALGTSFPALLEVLRTPSPSSVEVWSTPRGSSARLVNAVETAEVVTELWRWRLVEGDAFPVTPTPGHPDSLVDVLRGRLLVALPDGDLPVPEGDSARLTSHAPYVLRAGSDVVDFVRVVVLPRH